MAKYGECDSPFEVPFNKTPGNVGTSGEVGGEKLIDKETSVKSGGGSEFSTPFETVFPMKKG